MADSTQRPKTHEPECTVLGLFEQIEPAASTLKALRVDLEIVSEDLIVMTSTPLPEGVLQADESKSILPIITVIAAFVGIGLGLLLAGGSSVLYVLRTGGKPILSGPPIGIIAYEIMMLVALTSAFLSALYEMRLPGWHKKVYDSRIAEGMIGIGVRCNLTKLDKIKEQLIENGAASVSIDYRSFD